MVACQYITGDNTTKWHQLENFHSLKNAGRKVSDLRPEACCQVCPIKVDTGHSKAEPPETIKQRTKERVTECETESEQGRAKTTTHTKTQSWSCPGGQKNFNTVDLELELSVVLD